MSEETAKPGYGISTDQFIETTKEIEDIEDEISEIHDHRLEIEKILQILEKETEKYLIPKLINFLQKNLIMSEDYETLFKEMAEFSDNHCFAILCLRNIIENCIQVENELKNKYQFLMEKRASS